MIFIRDHLYWKMIGVNSSDRLPMVKYAFCAPKLIRNRPICVIVARRTVAFPLFSSACG